MTIVFASPSAVGRSAYDLACQAIEMRIVQAEPRDDLELAYVLLTIQHAAYALEAELIGDDRIPPLHENDDDIRSADLLWLVAFSGSRPIGAVGWSEDEEELDIDRLVVAPEMHRRGVGSMLVSAVLQRASKRRVIVSTGMKNSPAKSMYERLGFVKLDDVEVIPGLFVTRFRWTPIGPPTPR